MNPYGSLLAAAHLEDLLREADAERRARLVRGSGPSGLRTAFVQALGRVRSFRTIVARTGAGPTVPPVGRAAEA